MGPFQKGGKNHRIHGTGIFTYMKGEKWPHEQWEMAW